MTKALYFDAFSGVSGDMTVGAMLALGLPLDHLRAQLATLDVGARYELRQSVRDVSGIRAAKFDVLVAGTAADQHHHDHHHHHHGEGAAAANAGDHGHHHHAVGDHSHAGAADHAHTSFSDIRRRIAASGLEPAVRETALSIFTALAVAEGKIHGLAPENVTFHEVGAVDSIVDIVGTAIGLHHFGVEEIYTSPLPLGSGFVECRHGRMPVPAPATVELLCGFAVRYGDGEGELVTPTGAAILAALASRQALPAGFRTDKVGYGAGTRQLADRPNLLRLALGDVVAEQAPAGLVVIEANIDDSVPEIYEHAIELLFAAGARDVWLQPVVMKKGRPAVVLSVLGEAGRREVLAGIILRETSSIGVRHYPIERIEAPRREVVVETAYGPIPVKISRAPYGTPNIAPEYEACRRAARERNVALKEVYAAAQAAARSLYSPP